VEEAGHAALPGKLRQGLREIGIHAVDGQIRSEVDYLRPVPRPEPRVRTFDIVVSYDRSTPGLSARDAEARGFDIAACYGSY
jgi:hypothetical protein